MQLGFTGIGIDRCLESWTQSLSGKSSADGDFFADTRYDIAVAV